MAQIPKKLQAEYLKALRKLVTMMEHEFNDAYSEKVVPIMKKYYAERARLISEAESKMASNAKPRGTLYGIQSKLDTLLREAQNAADAEFSSKLTKIEELFNRSAERLAKNFVDAVSVSEKRQLLQEIRGTKTKVTKEQVKSIELLADKGINKIVNKTIGENVKLIQSIPQQHYKRVAKAVHDGIEKGQSYNTMAQEIKQINGVSDRKAKFIARDQTASVYGELTKQRSENIGIKKFQWITSHDNRVRPDHAALDGMVFEWETGASGSGVPSDMIGLVPGEDFNCRCTSRTTFEELEQILQTIG